MKKKLIITFCIGFISALGISVLADYMFNAKDIIYTPESIEWNVDTVQDAISDLKRTSVHVVEVTSANQTITIDTKKSNYTRFVALFIPNNTSYEPSEAIHYNGVSTSHLLGYKSGNSTVNYPCTNNTSMSNNTSVSNSIIEGNIWIYGSITNGVVTIKTPTDANVSNGKLYWWVD